MYAHTRIFETSNMYTVFLIFLVLKVNGCTSILHIHLWFFLGFSLAYFLVFQKLKKSSLLFEASIKIVIKSSYFHTIPKNFFRFFCKFGHSFLIFEIKKAKIRISRTHEISEKSWASSPWEQNLLDGILNFKKND